LPTADDIQEADVKATLKREGWLMTDTHAQYRMQRHGKASCPPFELA
jgi:hypothetical protein